MNDLPQLGAHLRQARKLRFPNDSLSAFALRLGISRATLQKMEKGDLSVTMGRYYRAAEVLGLTDNFNQLLEPEQSLFDD